MFNRVILILAQTTPLSISLTQQSGDPTESTAYTAIISHSELRIRFGTESDAITVHVRPRMF